MVEELSVGSVMWVKGLRRSKGTRSKRVKWNQVWWSRISMMVRVECWWLKIVRGLGSSGGRRE